MAQHRIQLMSSANRESKLHGNLPKPCKNRTMIKHVTPLYAASSWNNPIKPEIPMPFWDLRTYKSELWERSTRAAPVNESLPYGNNIFCTKNICYQASWSNSDCIAIEKCAINLSLFDWLDNWHLRACLKRFSNHSLFFCIIKIFWNV